MHSRLSGLTFNLGSLPSVSITRLYMISSGRSPRFTAKLVTSPGPASDFRHVVAVFVDVVPVVDQFVMNRLPKLSRFGT
ncbi:hypothetical protein Poly21_47470 [Allorhodopirellula heiligendammensis]|uniref:Uncharacterized protein n=1 Tax=Allorhodopirellula heiligendammensis TaxID=2714739 RepID=A0A5C6BH65_9BACT|nr:hypothetical protein Poly21_47470 [Allorhodopirellula heiligendammensis]